MECKNPAAPGEAKASSIKRLITRISPFQFAVLSLADVPFDAASMQLKSELRDQHQETIRELQPQQRREEGALLVKITSQYSDQSMPRVEKVE